MRGLATSGALRTETSQRRRFNLKLASAFGFWFIVVPALAASVASYAVTSSPPAENAGTLEAWLQDQAVLVWLAAFLTTTGLLRYWKPYLPPKQVWSTQQGERARSTVRELVHAAAWVIGATAAALALRAFVAEPAKVRSVSMLPTLHPGDLLLVSKWSRRSAGARAASVPERGRVILFATPDPDVRELEPALFKRVIGLPGDVLSVEQGTPVINGWRVPRCPVGLVTFDLPMLEGSTGGGLAVEWLGDETYLTLMDGVPSPEPQGPYTVKPGEVWVLGDNRNRSSDSRNWFAGKGGGVPLPAVEGYPTWSLLNTLGGTKARLARLRVPALPEGAEHLSSELARCLAKKPALTTPPPKK
ncbi:MAG: Signal peptidase [Polyangiaceae bacterium]|jgi:signal peptidase I|nr:Signal peptidase [Polyangiaceae bacterium]